jgi:transcriptional regulator with XRE-family HTH domain
VGEKRERDDNRAFRDRLERAARRVGSYYELARRAGIGEETLRNYRVRGSEPTRPILVAIAKAAGVGIGWLAAGRSDVSLRLLTEVVEELERCLEEADAEIEPRKKARLVAEIYLECEESGTKPEHRQILSLVRKAA